MKGLEPGDPQRVGRYRLLGRLGSGGMGRVFLGQSPGGRLVAVKLIRPELAADPEFRARFAREVAAARHVSGMFTAAVVDADPEGPQPWLDTAYVPGPSLSAAVARHGPLPVSSCLTLAAGLAEGVGAVHAAGMVHRDLKPSNVLLAGDGPRIIDFGISRAADATALTRADLVVGSPGFMSPEQAMGLEVGPASDIFSLGAVIIFAATGQGPFGTGSATALLYRVVHDPPGMDRLPGEIRPLASACLAKDPSRRPTSEQLLAQLGSAEPAANWLPWPVASEAVYPRTADAPQPWTLTEPFGPPPTRPAPEHLTPEHPAPEELAPEHLAPERSAPGQPGPHPQDPAQRGPHSQDPAPQGGPPSAIPRAGTPQPGPMRPPSRPVPRGRAPGTTRVLGQVPGQAGRAGRPGGPGQKRGPGRERGPGRRPGPGQSPSPGRPRRPGAGRPGPPAGRRRMGLWAASAVVVLAGIVAAVVALTSHSPGSGPATAPPPPGPRAVVLAYIAAINTRDWHRVWDLGGRNLSPSYHAMVAGYRLTAHDDLSNIRVKGDMVDGNLLARETTGAVQRYRMHYVVRDGVITAGRATLLGTS
ncbi:MAG TPA: protein kinase [Streptosporangiaceae bacterium]